jgi:hypothetical protein
MAFCHLLCEETGISTDLKVLAHYFKLSTDQRNVDYQFHPEDTGRGIP